jgi:N6-adenosine-specific RNA methylase IME4/DNA-binding transcriptional regulator YdaS (Cro superfamily)
MMGEEAYLELSADIEKNGLLEPIVTYEGKILDGRNRDSVCLALGIKPKCVEYTGDDPLSYVLSKNLKRRHLTASQRAMVAEKLANMPRGGDRKSENIKVENSTLISQDEAAKQLNVSRDSVNQAHKVRTKAVPEVADAVEAGKVTVSVAAWLADATPEQQREVIAKADKKAVLAVAREKQAEVREKKRKEVVAKLEDIATQEVKAAQGLYDVIVIDPPWDMKKIERDVAPEQVEFDYPTMTEEELTGFPIPAADDCHLWLWTTHKFLPVAMRLLEAWDFKYVCNFVWHKNGGFQPFGLPQYNCEFAIYARKGTPQFIDTKSFFTCFDAPRGAHSEKPEEFYEVVRRVTAGRRIDIFSRRKIEGFDGFGNQNPETKKEAK